MDLSGARTLIDTIYASYGGEQAGQPDSAFYTPELRAAIDRQGDEGGLGYDPLCQCQDFDQLRYELRSLEPTGAGAVARVEVEPFGDGEGSAITIRLARTGTAWQVADVEDEEGRSLLHGG